MAPSTVYQTYEAALGHAPLQSQLGQAWLKANGSLKDFLADRLRLALKERFPSLCTPDALAALGIERQIIRGAGETDAAYAQRVKGAWAAWPFAGTAFGMLSQFFATGYTGVQIATRNSIYSLDVNGNLVQTPTGTGGWAPGYPSLSSPFWSTFTVLFPHPWPATWSLTALTPVKAIAASTGAIGAAYTGPFSSPDYAFVVMIVVGGAPGTATFQYSTDNGVTYNIASTLSATVFLLQQVTLTASGNFTAGDLFYFSFQPPADSGPEANLTRAIIKAWKPAHATCNAITILQTGKLIGYPVRVLGGSNGVLGGASTTAWTPPT